MPVECGIEQISSELRIGPKQQDKDCDEAECRIDDRQGSGFDWNGEARQPSAKAKFALLITSDQTASK